MALMMAHVQVMTEHMKAGAYLPVFIMIHFGKRLGRLVE